MSLLDDAKELASDEMVQKAVIGLFIQVLRGLIVELAPKVAQNYSAMLDQAEALYRRWRDGKATRDEVMQIFDNIERLQDKILNS